MSAKIIFVNPPSTLKEIYGDFSGLGTINPPLTLLLLAAITRKAGYSTRIIDCPAEELSFENVVDIIVEENPLLVVMSPTTYAVSIAGKLAEMIKAKTTSIKIGVGGPHVSAIPE